MSFMIDSLMFKTLTTSTSKSKPKPKPLRTKSLLPTPVTVTVTPPDSFSDTSSSPHTGPSPRARILAEAEAAAITTTRITPVSRIIEILRSRRAGRARSLPPWQSFPLLHNDFDILISQLHDDEDLWGFFCSKVHYDYFWAWERFVLRMPTSVHELVISRIVFEIVRQLSGIAQRPVIPAHEIHLGSPTLKLPDDPGNVDATAHADDRHCPDAAFGLATERFPGVVLEVANTQKAKPLARIAEDYIIGSNGAIRVVVGLKVNYPGSKKATMSIWRSQYERAEDGAEEHICHAVVEDETFRDDQGDLCLDCPSLAFYIQDLAKTFRDIPATDETRIHILPATLHTILTEAEDAAAAAGIDPIIPLKPGARRRRRQPTPAEEIASDDERHFLAEEGHAAKRQAREDGSFPGRKGSRPADIERRRTRFQRSD